MHLVTRGDTGIKSISDLGGRRVSVGPEGSGTRHTALNLLSVAQPAIKVIHGDNTDPNAFDKMSPEEARDALRKQRIDAFFFMAGQPASLFLSEDQIIRSDDQKCDDRLQGLSFVPIKVPREFSKIYKKATLKYLCISLDPVETIAATTILLTYNFSTSNSYMTQKCKNMAVIAKLIRFHLSDLQKTGHQKWREVTEESLDAEVEEWKKSECVLDYETLPFNPDGELCNFDEYCKIRYRQGTSLRQECEFSRSH
jgi:hypothetical protein